MEFQAQQVVNFKNFVNESTTTFETIDCMAFL